MILQTLSCKIMDLGARQSKKNLRLCQPWHEKSWFEISPRQTKSTILPVLACKILDLEVARAAKSMIFRPLANKIMEWVIRQRQTRQFFTSDGTFSTSLATHGNNPNNPKWEVGRLANLNLVPTLCRTLCQPCANLGGLVSEICVWSSK